MNAALSRPVGESRFKYSIFQILPEVLDAWWEGVVGDEFLEGFEHGLAAGVCSSDGSVGVLEAEGEDCGVEV